MLQDLATLAGILAALTLGIVSPGPSFVLVARVAVSSSREQALGVAFGMGCGGLIFGIAALLGLQWVFLAVPSFYFFVKLAGGLYLVYIGILIFRSARRPLAFEGISKIDVRLKRSFWIGLSTQLSNPKTAIIYASVYASLLPENVSLGFFAVLFLLTFIIESGWYCLVAVLLSSTGPQKVYLSYKCSIDRTVGVVLTGLGCKLTASGGFSDFS